MKLNSRLITGATFVLTIAVGGAAFVLSFEAVRELAAANGVPGHLAWLFPLLADTVVIAAGLSVIAQHFEGEGARYQWGLVLVFTLLSVVLNFLHAPENWVARGLSVVPPLALFLTFELLSVQIRRSALRSEKTDTLRVLSAQIETARRQVDTQKASLDKDIADLTARRDKLVQDIEQLKMDKRETKRDKPMDKPAPVQDMALTPVQRRERVVQIIRTANGHGAPSVEDIADKLGVHPKTIKRDLVEIERQKVSAN